MLYLLKIIEDRLNATGYNTFFNEKSDKVNYPFVIFNLPISNAGSILCREDFTLEVDIWTKDIIQCITMTDNIKILFNRYEYRDEEVYVGFYIVDRLNNIPDEDSQIKRSKLRIQVLTYK